MTLLLSPSPFYSFSPALRHPFEMMDELERHAMRSLSIESDESEDSYGLTVAVPGVRPADLEVSVVGRKLRVAAKNSRGTFERQLTLPKDADAAASKATMMGKMMSSMATAAQETTGDLGIWYTACSRVMRSSIKRVRGGVKRRRTARLPP